jgi:hypothetical protein
MTVQLLKIELMKTTILMTLLCIGLSIGTSAQTKMIAHRSHSGPTADFSPAGDDNFGNPPMHMDTLIRLSDTAIVEIMSYGYGDAPQRDTVYNHPYFNKPGISMEEIQSMYPRFTVFIGFENLPMKKKIDIAPRTNSLYLLGFVLCAMGGAYVFGPKVRFRKN